jgi:hypothetical protein
MNKSPNVSAKEAFEALSAVGFPKKYVQRLLPDWWDNALFKTSSGAIEFASIVKQRLGVDVKFDQDGELRVLATNQPARFKRRADTREVELQVSATLGIALARLALYCTPEPYAQLPDDPKILGKRVRAFAGDAAISFQGLVEFCWASGVPVLFLKDVPKTAKRVTGMAVRIDTRPVIVLGYQSKQSARQLFVLAHELAHICLGHVSDTGVLIDEDLNAINEAIDGAPIEKQDREEKQADKFALTLLGNGTAVVLREGARFTSASELAGAAAVEGASRGIDPGHLVLCYAKAHEDWRLGNQAQSYFPDSDKAIDTLHHSFMVNAHLARLTDENRQYLLDVQGFQ